ncbi:MAG: methionyl-tRNA formyltransferase [Gammaproteobacteria bacterium]|jgi:methionyl-tRNA formyltransferase
MKLIFAGTPEFAAILLAGLIDSTHQVIAVYTQPDRASGRGRKVRAGAVKTLAEQHSITVLQPPSLRDLDVQQELADHRADLMVVVAYGLLLPPSVLEIPPLGCINVHASLLPRWRGAAPIQRAIEAGDGETGVCIMRMEKGLDTGPVIARNACSIGARDTAADLHDKLAELGSDLLLKVLEPLSRGTLSETAQDDADATYAKRFTSTDAQIDWRRDAIDLDRQIRAFNPSPGAWTHWTQAGQTPTRLRVLRARPLDEPQMTGQAGEVLRAHDGELVVACGSNALALEQVQAAGRRAVTAIEFLNGGAIHPGERLQ